MVWRIAHPRVRRVRVNVSGTLTQPGLHGTLTRPGRLLLAVAICVSLAPQSAEPQTPRPREPATLSQRMRAFLELVDGAPAEIVAAYFPRRGDWTWYQTVHHDGGADRAGVWRFPGASTRDAIRRCGPAWESFAFQPEGQPLGVLSSQVLDHGTRWRRVGGTRFVPPGAPARSPVFVEWRREDGAWVVSSFGDESFRARPLPGRAASMVRRDTTGPLPAEERFASGQPWFESNESITFDELRYIKYGNPRALDRNDLTWIGVRGPIRVYVERDEARVPHVIHIPTAPGIYQPYKSDQAPLCQ
jgi:hypothetical protein